MWAKLLLGFAVFALAVLAGLCPAPAAAPATPNTSSSSPATDTAIAPSERMSAERLYAACSPAVVTVTVANEAGKTIRSGSGFLVRGEELRIAAGQIVSLHKSGQFLSQVEKKPHQVGYVVTCDHVLRGAVSVTLELSNGTHGKASDVIAASQEADLAVLSVYVASANDLPTMQVSRARPPVGATVYAIGSPGGDLTNSISAGIISGIRQVPNRGECLQITTPISPGSSGGPVLLSNGHVVGVATATRTSGQNLNFAVSILELDRVLQPPDRSREVWRGSSIRREEDEAYRDLRLAVLIKGSHDNSDEPEDSLLTAISLERQGKHQQAADVVLAVREQLPDQWKYLAEYTLGLAYGGLVFSESQASPGSTIEETFAAVRNAQHYPECLEAYEKAARLKSAFAPAHKWLAHWHGAAGRSAKALISADRLAVLVPNCCEAYWNRGMRFRDLGDKESALADCRMAVDLNPLDANAHYELARVHSDAGNDDDAVASYLHAAQLGHVAPWLCYGSAGGILERNGKIEKAIAMYKQGEASGAPPDSNSAAIIRARLQMLQGR